MARYDRDLSVLRKLEPKEPLAIVRPGHTTPKANIAWPAGVDGKVVRQIKPAVLPLVMLGGGCRRGFGSCRRRRRRGIFGWRGWIRRSREGVVGDGAGVQVLGAFARGEAGGDGSGLELLVIPDNQNPMDDGTWRDYATRVPFIFAVWAAMRPRIGLPHLPVRMRLTISGATSARPRASALRATSRRARCGIVGLQNRGGLREYQCSAIEIEVRWITAGGR